MDWYHIVMEMRTENKGRTIYLLSLDKREKEARHVVDALTKKKEFLFEGEKIRPSVAHRISLFRTSKTTAELVLPNGKSIADYKNSECKPLGCCKHRYIATCLSKGKLKGANDCTKEFTQDKRG